MKNNIDEYKITTQELIEMDGGTVTDGECSVTFDDGKIFWIELCGLSVPIDKVEKFVKCMKSMVQMFDDRN